MNSQELADWLRISVRAVERWRESQVADGPPYVRVGKAVRYRRADIEEWLKQRRVAN